MPNSVLPENVPNYGRNKGRPIADLETDDLLWYQNNAQRSLADPNKASFHTKDALLVAAIQSEISARKPNIKAPAMDAPMDPPFGRNS